ncbi:DUF3841 domain-containing protein [Ornithinibacillus scapharcae]|uniref:DUF3841 domain-containing protein n=1 Tax=Ornithinibacillus scapharcae TaxID=1147159 RepID=UPI000225AFF7|nr:DUF3841 domain-containing protein [Ornithinibacillus scapharcae]
MGIYYTNQTIEAYNKLAENGCLTGDSDYVDRDFLRPYKWIIEQMKKRINHDGSYPIWVWTRKPNVNDEGHLPKGTKGVCLTIEVPDDKVLLSDFDAWHCVLNDGFCSLTEQEYELFELGKSKVTKEHSWERIFNLELLQKSEIWRGNDMIVQGVTSNISKDQIINIQHFTAR